MGCLYVLFVLLLSGFLIYVFWATGDVGLGIGGTIGVLIGLLFALIDCDFDLESKEEKEDILDWAESVEHRKTFRSSGSGKFFWGLAGLFIGLSIGDDD